MNVNVQCLRNRQKGVLPAAFGALDPSSGAPSNAIWLVTAANAVGIVLGSGAIVPIINMATTCTSLIKVLCLAVLIKLRREQPAAPGFAVPGGTRTVAACMAGALIMAGFALWQPLRLAPHAVPLQWVLMVIWAGLGLVFSRFAVRERFRNGAQS